MLTFCKKQYNAVKKIVVMCCDNVIINNIIDVLYNVRGMYYALHRPKGG